ncbi:MAG TPA: GntR family transcriptional regulator, partial [Kineosporiaceae bacterium]|nr:GntR family transcriptional regulator [Kineosporiaceae bacterium]
PSGPELATRYGVSRQTIQQALKPLRDEGLIVSQQGRGTYVRSRAERPVELRPHLERAFSAPDVFIDFSGFSGETLSGALQEPLDKIRGGTLAPRSISVRILIPDTERPWSIPCLTETLQDSPEFRRRMARIADRSVGQLAHSIEELSALQLVPETSVMVRSMPSVPLFKVYIINKAEIFFGLYPITEHKLKLGDDMQTVWDLTGKDASLFHQANEGANSTGALYVEQYQNWFNSMWESVARELSL